MAYEWGRFMWWLAQGQNAAAVQAVTAIITLIITAILTGITWLYVRLTKSMVDTSLRQTVAQYQPTVNIDLDKTTFEGEVGFSIQNLGSRPVRLVCVNVDWRYKDDPFKWGRICISNKNRKLLEPKGQVRMVTKLVEDLEMIRPHFNDLTVIVDCVDLSAPGVHCFTYSRNAGLEYCDWFRGMLLPNEMPFISFGDRLS